MTSRWWLAVGFVIGLGLYGFAAEKLMETLTVEVDTAITLGVGGLLIGFCGAMLYLRRGGKS